MLLLFAYYKFELDNPSFPLSELKVKPKLFPAMYVHVIVSGPYDFAILNYYMRMRMGMRMKEEMSGMAFHYNDKK